MSVDRMKEICGKCGNTYGEHNGDKHGKWPYHYCPTNDTVMDWEDGPGTRFAPTGIYKVD